MCSVCKVPLCTRVVVGEDSSHFDMWHQVRDLQEVHCECVSKLTEIRAENAFRRDRQSDGQSDDQEEEDDDNLVAGGQQESRAEQDVERFMREVADPVIDDATMPDTAMPPLPPTGNPLFDYTQDSTDTQHDEASTQHAEAPTQDGESC